jgi:hypothetical protein
MEDHVLGFVVGKQGAAVLRPYREFIPIYAMLVRDPNEREDVLRIAAPCIPGRLSLT